MRMRPRRSRRRLAATTLTLLASCIALQAAEANPPRSLSTQSGSSTESGLCPDGWFEWESDVGVAQCGDDDFDLIVIDPLAGAKIRVVSEWDDSSPEAPSSDARFNKKTAFEWAEHIAGGGGPAIPSPSELTHVVNAGFLVSDAPGSTPLSLPELRTGGVETLGYALTHPSDPAFTWPDKRYITLGSPAGSVQWADVYRFPWGGGAGYTADDVYNVFNAAYDGTVGFGPDDAPSDGNVQKARTFFLLQMQSIPDGVPPRRYVLTANNATLAEMNAKVAELNTQADFEVGPYEMVQLDGGRSSQWYSVDRDYWWHGGLPRPVPEVLAIYHG